MGHVLPVLQVYRMHALLPDKVTLRSSSTGKETGSVDFGDIILDRGTAVNTTMPLADLFTTLGMGEAGEGDRVVWKRGMACLRGEQNTCSCCGTLPPVDVVW
jgi:hypothetical protein